MSGYIITRNKKSTSVTTRINHTSSHLNGPSKWTEDVKPKFTNNAEVLFSSSLTWHSIMEWPLNLNNNNIHYHPCSNRQSASYNVGDILEHKCIGDRSKDCLVKVIKKFPVTEYDTLKKSVIVGPFSAEAAFPGKDYSDTYLILVEKV